MEGRLESDPNQRSYTQHSVDGNSISNLSYNRAPMFAPTHSIQHSTHSGVSGSGNDVATSAGTDSLRGSTKTPDQFVYDGSTHSVGGGISASRHSSGEGVPTDTNAIRNRDRRAVKALAGEYIYPQIYRFVFL